MDTHFKPEEDYLQELQDDLADVEEVIEELSNKFSNLKDKLAEEWQ